LPISTEIDVRGAGLARTPGRVFALNRRLAANDGVEKVGLGSGAR
jgi:hypothetical protein